MDRSASTWGAAARQSIDAMWRVVVALIVTIVASSTTFNAVTVALPKLFAERLTMLTTSPALIGLIASGVYVFGAMTRAHDRQHHRPALTEKHLPAAGRRVPAAAVPRLRAERVADFVVVSIGIIAAMFGLGSASVNDAMVGKYTSDQWRARAFRRAVFSGVCHRRRIFGRPGGGQWLHETGGFGVMLQAFGAFCLLIVAGALIFPPERRIPAAQPAE